MAELSEVRVDHNDSIHSKQINSQKIEQVKEDLEWSICCSHSSSYFIKYLVQVIVSMTILVFAIAMIATGHDDAVYWSLVTLIVGVFIPSPSLATGGATVKG